MGGLVCVKVVTDVVISWSQYRVPTWFNCYDSLLLPEVVVHDGRGSLFPSVEGVWAGATRPTGRARQERPSRMGRSERASPGRASGRESKLEP